MNVFAKQDHELEGRAGAYPPRYPGMLASGVEPEADEKDAFDLRGLFLTVWRRKWMVMICAVTAVALAVLAVSQVEPRYRATGKVLFEPERLNIIDLEDVLVNSQDASDGLANQIEILRSTSLLERVVDALDLGATPEFNPELRTAPPTLIEQARALLRAPVAGVREVLANLGAVAPPPAATPDPEEVHRLRRLALIEQLRGGLSLRPIVGSRVIEIGYTSTNPRLAARIVNTVAEQYIVDQLDAKLEATRSATEWLSGRVQELQERVRTSELAVEEARAELSLDAGQGSDVTREQVQAMNASLTGARAKLSGLEARYERVADALASGGDFGAVSEFREAAIIQAYRQQESELLAQEISLGASVPEGHPALARLNRQLDEVRRNIRAEAERVTAALQNDLNAARAEEAALAAELRELETKALEQSQAELRLRQLEREAEAGRLLYENFLARLKETSEQQGLQTADARILSAAEPPSIPESASKKRTVVLAGMGGVMLGVGLIFLLERLNNTYRSPAELEAKTGQPVLAALPRIGSRLRRREVLAHLRSKPNSSLAEAVRNLRTSILFSNIDNPPRVVMFTSTAPREGKSTTSMLIAMTGQQMGKSAVIVDCDLRMPTLGDLLGDRREAGLMKVLQGEATIDEAIVVEPETGLHVLTSRPPERHAPISAADILASRRFRQLIEELKDRYDLVVLDTPPALVVTDARIVASLCDAVVYAVRWDDTPRGAVLEGLRELTSVKAPIAGLVLTMVNEARAAKYAYDGYGYYKGRYKDYYVS